MKAGIIYGGIGHWRQVLSMIDDAEVEYNYSAGEPYDSFYNANWNDLIRNDYDAYEVDLIVGSPPCIGVSGANCHHCGEDNANNEGMINFSKKIKELKPRMFVMEMVPGLNKYPALKNQVLGNFKGYTLTEFEADSQYYKSYQVRKRLYFVGSLTKTNFTLPMKLPNFDLQVLLKMKKFKQISNGMPLPGKKGPYSHWLNKDKRDIKKRMKCFTITSYCTKDIFYDGKFLKFEVAASIMGFPPRYKYPNMALAPRMISHGIDIRSVLYFLSHWIKEEFK